MNPLPQPRLHKSTYDKLDSNELLVEDTWAALKRVWANQIVIGRDPWVNWELGWRAIKKEIKMICTSKEEEKN